jgi:hypothetical protein
MMVVLFAVPAQAQHGRGKRQSDPNQAQSAEAKSKKARAEEKAAKSAIEQLPDKPYDPWRTMRQ